MIERRAGVRLGLGERLHRLRVVGADRDLRDVDVAVGHGDQPEVLLRGRLAGRGELRDGAARRRLRRLAAGVRVDLGVEHEDVDVAPGREHVVEAAEADVVGPAVAADDPDALADEGVGERLEAPRGRECPCRARRSAQRADAVALGGDSRLDRVRRAPSSRARRPDPRPSSRDEPARVLASDWRRARAACRARTPRCPRTASSTRPGRGRRVRPTTASSAGCRRRSTSSRSRWRRASGRRRAA